MKTADTPLARKVKAEVQRRFAHSKQIQVESMTDRDQIIAWAREAGGSYLGRYDLHQFTSAELQALIRIVAAHEREQCARVCDLVQSGQPTGIAAYVCAAAIRGRAEK